jgi:hypothetical protein
MRWLVGHVCALLLLPPSLCLSLMLSVLVLLVAGAVAGCAQGPLPALASPQSCGSNPCATLNCPSAYSCRIDAKCGAHCEPERVSDKIF